MRGAQAEVQLVVTRDGVRSVRVERDTAADEHAPLIVDDEWAVPQADRQLQLQQRAQLRAAAVRGVRPPSRPSVCVAVRGGLRGDTEERGVCGQVRKYIGGDDSEASAGGEGAEGGAAGAAAEAAEVGAGAGEDDADEGGRHLFRAGRSDARVLPNSKRRRRGAGGAEAATEGEAMTATGGARAKPQLLSFCADE